ncbi:MAG: hypothetical protein ACOX6T_00200 [Myxococcales bacterium]|jgi:hypothetical protein
MSRSRIWSAIFILGVFVTACAGNEHNLAPDAGVLDAAIATDSGLPEDAGEVAPDAGEEPDAGEIPDASVEVPLPGFGAISGACGVLDDELTSPDPFVIHNSIDFGDDPYDDEDFELLTDGGQEIINDGNAGGSSLLSEVFAYEVLERCELASLLATEMEVSYLDPDSKITDLLVEIDGMKIGVSVTRAVGYPREAPYPLATAKSLLQKKLEGILDSSENVAPEHKWVKQILHVLAYSADHATVMEQAWNETADTLKADTILLITVTDGDDEFMYSNN